MTKSYVTSNETLPFGSRIIKAKILDKEKKRDIFVEQSSSLLHAQAYSFYLEKKRRQTSLTL